MIKNIFLHLLCSFFVSISFNLKASIVTYMNKSAFLLATGGTSATGPLPNLGFISGNLTTVGSVTFSISAPSSNFAIGSAGISQIPSSGWYSLLPGNDIAIGGSENLNANFPGLIYSAGFDFAEPDSTMPIPHGNSNNPFGVNSFFTVTLKNGSTTVDSFTFDAPDDVVSFVGVWSDVPFDRLEIHETSGGIDDEYFGEFFTGTAPLPASAVPTISQWGLIILGLTLLCLGGIVLHRQGKVVAA